MEDYRPAKILMTADTVGGVWTYALDLIRALAPYGTHVFLATMGGPLSPHQRNEAAQLSNLTIYESNYKLEWMDDPWEDVEKAGEWLLQLCEELQPDLIHLNGMVHGNLNWSKPVLVVVHSCVLSWWRVVKNEEAPDSWNRYQERVGDGLRAADWVVAPTQAMLLEAEDLYGAFQQQSVIYNGRDPYEFYSGQKQPFIFSMGRIWDEAKNISLLAQAAAGLQWPVYIAGDSIHPATGQAMTLENVNFLGRLASEEVRHWLSKAAIYALPAKYEPFGLSILEAALSGCALVIGKTESLTEVWEEAAVYVDPTDADELRHTINYLINDEVARQTGAQLAVERARIYTTERMGQEYIQLYGQFLRATEPTIGALNACALDEVHTINNAFSTI